MDRVKTFESRQNGVMSASAKVLRHTHQRTENLAQSMSRLGLARASCELCNEAVTLLINLCYAVDPDVGTQVNIDTSTCQILIPLPWGYRYRRWGLRRTEAIILRRHMLALQQGKPLFYFDDDCRRWFVNPVYNLKTSAHEYWKNHELTAPQYAKYNQAMRSNRSNSGRKP